MTKKDKRNLIITGILLVVLIGVGANMFSTLAKNKKKKESRRPADAQTKTKDEVLKDAQNTVASFSVTDSTAIALSSRPTKAVLKKEAMDIQKKIAEGEWGADPFYHDYKEPVQDKPGDDIASPVYGSPDVKEIVRSSFELTGISRVKNIFIAVINRKIIKTGDQLSVDTHAFDVRDITKDKVILEANGGVYELRLKK